VAPFSLLTWACGSVTDWLTRKNDQAELQPCDYGIIDGEFWSESAEREWFREYINRTDDLSGVSAEVCARAYL
jgi:hypothetical protein